MVGLIGAGNMAGALARGWTRRSGTGRDLVSDIDDERARPCAKRSAAAGPRQP